MELKDFEIVVEDVEKELNTKGYTIESAIELVDNIRFNVLCISKQGNKCKYTIHISDDLILTSKDSVLSILNVDTIIQNMNGDLDE